MAEKKKESPGLLFYFDDFGAVLDTLNDEETGFIVRALFHYFGTGEEPKSFGSRVMEMGYRLLKPSIVRDREKYLKTCEHRSTAMKNYWEEVHEAKNTIAAIGMNANANANENPNASAKKDAHPPRHEYGEYKNVLLSDDDLEKLKCEFPRNWASLIEELSTAMASKGLKYKNHLATLRAWAKKDGIARQGGAVPAAEAQKPAARKSRTPDDVMRDPDHPGNWILKPEIAAREASERNGGEDA